MQAMVTDHEKAIALFKTGAADKNAKSDFAAKMLPKLEGHLTRSKRYLCRIKIVSTVAERAV
jgi:predicted outer membrane protein